MSVRSYGSMIGALLLSLGSVAPAAADAVVQTSGTADRPAVTTAAPAAQPAPSAGSVQSAPNTTVVQPTPSPTVVQPAPSTTVVQPAPTTAEPRERSAVVQQTNVDTGEDEAPSVFSRASQGLLAGSLAGASVGYLVGRRDGWERSDWRSVGLGLGVGALSGAGLGLMFGFMDQGGVRAGRYIPRDMLAGAGLGAVVGVVAGGIAAAAANDGERVAYGASIGILAGAGLGLITGIVQGQTKANRGDVQSTTVTSRLKLAPTVAWTRTSPQSSVVMPALAGRF